MTDTMSPLPAAGLEWFADIAGYRNEPIDITMATLVPILERLMQDDPAPTPTPPLAWPDVLVALQHLDPAVGRILVFQLEPFLDLLVTGRQTTGANGESMVYGIACYPGEVPDPVRGEVFMIGPGPDGLAQVIPANRFLEQYGAPMIRSRSIKAVHRATLSPKRGQRVKWRSTSRKNRRQS